MYIWDIKRQIISDMNKYCFSARLRNLGLIRLTDRFSFYFKYLRTYKTRNAFLKNNPHVKLPPAYYIYETFNLNYFSFYNNSIDTTQWLINLFKKYKTLKSLNILDWGCGPGRIIRHLPSFIDNSCSLYGTDYNEKYIKWCRKNISGISFSQNHLFPPMDYEDNFFDIIYGISIFTHLSEEMHHKWFNELMRILKPGGVLLLTLHGDAFKVQLTKSEREKYDTGVLVVKSKTKEGHRTFGAFQPIDFVKALIGKNEIVEYVNGEVKNGKPQQDVWIIRKRIQKN